ncbi:MAG: DUF362 domain-containing protein [Acidobacteria bacterium]|nr:DUF362 domain-containing protein [Acidobacteriota bacterium]
MGDFGMDRRKFFKTLGLCSMVAGGVVLGVPASAADAEPEPPVTTNIDDFMKAPRGPHALPGLRPGKVVQVTDPSAIHQGRIMAEPVRDMVRRAITELTGQDLEQSFRLMFTVDDVVGLKVNPVGAPLISTRLEVVDALIEWLTANGLPRRNIVIWDRFEDMLTEAGYTPERFPGLRIEALQTMGDESNLWRDAAGNHVSQGNFDRDVFYLARGVAGKNVRGYKDDEYYLNQHVFNGEYSYFGKLLTQSLTKIINIPVFKNTGNGISMATKNLGYGAICNTGRLHQPLFFKVCTEVLAAPVIRDKLVLNITDGLRGQYDGGPMKNEQFVYEYATIYAATDPFALDMICHNQITAKRKEMGVKVNEHPRFTEYLHYAASLGLGVADPARIHHVQVRI